MWLEGKLMRVREVTPAQRDQMYALMDRHYEGMRRADFESDLAEKQWVIALLDRITGEVLGFSTQMILDAEVEGRRVKALFSGDTIVDEGHWGKNNLLQVWGRLALSLIDRDAETPLYWFLISKGYKTYRFLPLFFHEYFPRNNVHMAPELRSVRDALALSKYPEQFDCDLGIIRAGPNSCRLREGIAPITLDRLRDPHVRYFAEINPGHARGDELCCVAPLTRENFTRAAYRAIGEESPLELAVASC